MSSRLRRRILRTAAILVTEDFPWGKDTGVKNTCNYSQLCEVFPVIWNVRELKMNKDDKYLELIFDWWGKVNSNGVLSCQNGSCIKGFPVTTHHKTFSLESCPNSLATQLAKQCLV